MGEARAGGSSYESQSVHTDGRHFVSYPARTSERYGLTTTSADILKQAPRGVDNNLPRATGTLTRKGPGHRAKGLSFEGSLAQHDHPVLGTNAARRHYRSMIAHRSGWATGGYQVIMNSCTRAIRIGSLMLALTVVGWATGSTLFMTSASAIAQDVTPMTTFNGVACASASQCIGVGNVVSSVNSGAAASLDPVSGDLSTGQPLQLIRSSGFLNGVSCPSGAVCLAVGENRNETRGIAVPLNPDTAMVRSGQELHIISGIFISGVACASRKQCLAVGHDSSGSGVVVVSAFALSRSPTFKLSTTGPLGFCLFDRTSLRPFGPFDELRNLARQMLG